MLALVGRVGDGWLPSSFFVPPERLPEMQARIDEAAATAGRNPAAVRRAYNIGGAITDGASRGFLKGPVASSGPKTRRSASSNASPRRSAPPCWTWWPRRDGSRRRDVPRRPD
jgi:Luciferase-like monooxygenase